LDYNYERLSEGAHCALAHPGFRTAHLLCHRGEYHLRHCHLQRSCCGIRARPLDQFTHWHVSRDRNPTGAITGAFLAGLLAPNLLFVLFGVILLLSALPQVFKISEELPQGAKNDRLANWLRLSSTYPDQHLERDVTYQVTRTPPDLAMMYIAGIISGLLGIGSGTFKVLALDTKIRRFYL